MQHGTVFLRMQYLENNALVLAETFRLIYGPQELHVGKVLGRNSLIRFFCEYLIIGGKPNKMTITREERPMGPCPFGLFLVS
jgi:hypothetical protein